jgi:serine/threonine protein kinase
MIGVRVLALCDDGRPWGEKTAPLRASARGARSAGAQARVFSGFPRLQELRHPNLAPYIDLYEIRGRAYLLSYHTRATLASLLLADSAVPEAPTGWDREVERDGAAGVHAAKGVEAVAEGAGEGRRLSAAAGLRVCLQVGRAVEYLHARGLVHGRITPHCILLAPWREPRAQGGAQTVLLSDYGAQHLINGSEDASLVPPLEYCAPEIIAARLLRRANPCAHPPAREPAGGPADDFQAADDAVLHFQKYAV